MFEANEHKPDRFYNNTLSVYYNAVTLFKQLNTHVKLRRFFPVFFFMQSSFSLNSNYTNFKINTRKVRKKKHYFKNKFYLVQKNIFKAKRLLFKKTRKVTAVHNLKNIIRNRRILRHLFSISKLKSNYLTKIISRVSNKFTCGRIGFLVSCIGFVLLRSHVLFSLIDSYWFIHNGFVNLNSKPCLNFFGNLEKGDVISVNNYSLKTSFIYYYKRYYFKWLKRKIRKTRFLVRRYSIYNKKIRNNVLNRWVLNRKMFNSVNSDFHCDYKSGIIVFLGINNMSKTNKSRNFMFLLSSNAFIFNNWHYSH